jgi:Uma2 family endonuclease
MFVGSPCDTLWSVDPIFFQAEAIGLKLEIVNGMPLWEAHPAPRHQLAVDRIRASIRQGSAKTEPPCQCIHLADVYVHFTEGSLKRPDIAIFCRTPDELDDAVTLVPEAVIEVVSAGYEAKDFDIAPSFYRAMGVKDVVIFDPRSLVVLHVTAVGATRYVSPVRLEFACGCTAEV